MEELLVILICLVLNSLLSAFEMAFVSVPKAELRKLSREGVLIASKLLPLRDNPERTLSVIQIGITLVGAISAAVGGAGASETLEPIFVSTLGWSETVSEFVSIFIVVLPLTYLSVVVGELVPKTLALRNPTGIVLNGARFLIHADRFLGPIITLLENSTKLMVRMFFKKNTSIPQQQEEFVDLAEFSSQHRQLILNMANIEKKLVKDFYVPFQNVISISTQATINDVIDVIFKSNHTRYPVIHEGKIKGIINAKEVLSARESGINDWLTVLRPAIQIAEKESAFHAFALLQRKRSHMAIVGDMKGIVTLEDISEEIFGEIYDEHEDGQIQKLIASRVRSRSKNLQE